MESLNNTSLNTDVIIVGTGLAGLSIAETLLQNKISFICIDNQKLNASSVSSGIYNPIIFKRYSIAWNSDKILLDSLLFYQKIGEKLNMNINFSMPIIKFFNTSQEQNQWAIASEKNRLSNFMQSKIYNEAKSYLVDNNGYGKLKNVGKIDTNKLIREYTKWLETENIFLKTEFDYSKLVLNNKNIKYGNITAKHIIFCEGHLVKKNPFFNWLPLIPCKGEILHIETNDLPNDSILKSSIYLSPIKNGLFWAGSNFNWKFKNISPTLLGKKYLESEINKKFNISYKIKKHSAHIRPTVIDRKPLVGTHPKYKNVHIINGLGTRGVTLAPWVAKELVNYIYNKKSILPEININRFNFEVKT